MKEYIFVAFCLILVLISCNAATIQGSIYAWDTLEKVKNAIVDINSVPFQRVVAKDGDYLFSVPPGSYKIKASYYVENEPRYYGEETITINADGNFYLDLILFQTIDVNNEDVNLDENTAKELETATEFEDMETKKRDISLAMISILAAILLAGISFYMYKKQVEKLKEMKKDAKPKEESKESFETKKEVKLDKYALDVIELLRRSGNRLTQKEIRERMRLSEAKISLIIAELESEGLIKKIKKGRGNIIIYKENT